jgi:DNA-binding transcriptional ArsR family regulator
MTAPDLRPHRAGAGTAGHGGDADVAAVAQLFADRSRAAVMMALYDGRALPASLLASEAGVSASTISGHLSQLLDAGLVQVERHGRHRYYRLAGSQVAEILERLAVFSAPKPVRSLRDGNRGKALRAARTCYDHLAGRLGVEIMSTMIARGYLEGGDGEFRPETARRDRLSAYGRDVTYGITRSGGLFLDGLNITIPPARRPTVRYCVDWSEQRHHVAGSLGRALLDRALADGWIVRAPRGRAVHVTGRGREALSGHFGIDWSARDTVASPR